MGSSSKLLLASASTTDTTVPMQQQPASCGRVTNLRSSSNTGQCHRYTPYDTLPSATIGRLPNTRATGCAVAVLQRAQQHQGGSGGEHTAGARPHLERRRRQEQQKRDGHDLADTVGHRPAAGGAERTNARATTASAAPPSNWYTRLWVPKYASEASPDRPVEPQAEQRQRRQNGGDQQHAARRRRSAAGRRRRRLTQNTSATTAGQTK